MRVVNFTNNNNFWHSCAYLITNNSQNDYLKLAKTIIICPTFSYKDRLIEAISNLNNGNCLLPQIKTISDLEITNGNISKEEEKLLLAKFINFNKNIKYKEALSRAENLLNLKQDLVNNKIETKDLEDLVEDSNKESWQQILDFINIINIDWQNELNNNNLKSNIDKSLNLTNNKNYNYYFIGFNEFNLKLTNLLKKFKNNENFNLVLDNLDRQIIHKNIPASHPQFEYFNLLKNLGINPEDIEDIKNAANIFPINDALITEESFANWDNKFKDLDKYLSNLFYIEANSSAEEAFILASYIRKEIDTNKNNKIGIVSHNESLNKNLENILKIWDIRLDKSQKPKILEHFLGTLIKLLFELLNSSFNDKLFLSILKLSISNFGKENFDHNNNLLLFESKVLRAGDFSQTKLSDYIEYTNIYAPELVTWLKDIENILNKILNLKNKNLEFAEFIEVFNEIIFNIAPKNNNDLAFKSLEEFLTDIQKYNKIFGKISTHDFEAIFLDLISNITYQQHYNYQTNVSLINLQESYLNNFDIIFITSFNEGNFPKIDKLPPWFNLSMMKKLNLPTFDNKIGLQGFQFCSLFKYNKIYISRALKDGGSQTIPSRWLQKIDAFLKNNNHIGLENLKILDHENWLKFFKDIDNVSDYKITKPFPIPPQDARPTKYSATNIEYLLKDPYSIYASKILKLYPIKPLDYEAQAQDFGNFLHDALDYFMKNLSQIKESDYEQQLLLIGKESLAKINLNPATKIFWQSRYALIIRWFSENLKKQKPKYVRTEIKGDYNFTIQDVNYNLNAKADRIEINSDNILTIIDYKTGTIPSKAKILQGLSPQMLIETLIAKKGGYKINLTDIGFEDINIEYWRFKHTEPICEITKIFKKGEADYHLEQTENGIKNLLEYFHSPNTPFMSVPDDDIAPNFNNYEHLARVKEWK